MDVNQPIRNYKLIIRIRELITSSTPTVPLRKKDYDPVDTPQVAADIGDKAPEPMEVEPGSELPDQQKAPLYRKLLPESCLAHGEIVETVETDTTAQIEQDPAIETEEDPKERKGQQRTAFLKAQERIQDWTRDLISSL